MALIIGVAEEDDFFVGDQRIIVKAIQDELHYTVAVMKEDGVTVEQEIAIDDTEAKEILPNVFVSAGKRGMVDLARVSVAAPRTLKILRGNLYREAHPECQF